MAVVVWTDTYSSVLKMLMPVIDKTQNFPMDENCLPIFQPPRRLVAWDRIHFRKFIQRGRGLDWDCNRSLMMNSPIKGKMSA